MPPKKYTTFETEFGTFSVHAHADKIAAIIEECDKAQESARDSHHNLFVISKLGYALKASNEALGMPGGLLDTPVGTCAYYNELLAMEEDEQEYSSDMSPLSWSTRAWEFLAGGVFSNLPDNVDLVALKPVARLIAGEKKAAIAEGLTESEKGEIKGFVRGMGLGLQTLSKGLEYFVGAQKMREINERCDMGHGEEFNSAHCYLNGQVDKIKDAFPPKFYELVCERDARPWLIFPFARELYEHYEADYERTVEFMKELFKSGGLHQEALDALDDTARPLEQRLALLQDSRDAWEKKREERRKQREEERARNPQPPRPASNPANEAYWAEKERKRRLGEQGREKIRSCGKRRVREA